MKTVQLSILLPTYNEKENIELLIPAIHNQLKDLYTHEIILVDDNSPDNTAEAGINLSHILPKGVVRVEKRLKDHGLTKSIQHGIDVSIGDIIVWLDADGSMGADTIPKMIESLENDVDIIVASRFKKGGQAKKLNNATDSPIVTVLSYVLNIFLRLILRTPVTDYTSGFIAVRKKVLDEIRLQGDYGEYFIDLVVRAHRKGFVIKEVPHTYLPRMYGESKTSTNFLSIIKRGLPYLQTVFRLL